MKAIAKASTATSAGRRRFVPALFITALALLILPATASAATPELLWQVPESGAIGSGAGQLDHPGAIATHPSSGHVYVADNFNSRVSEFDAWGQFVKAWGWGVADGSSELQTCGPAEPETPPPPALCQKGLAGAGAGQFEEARGGIAVGDEGSIFVGDLRNSRIEKFDPDGNFLLAFGTAGEGDGQFATDGSGNHIAVGPTGTIFVGDNKGRIQEFDPDGSFKSKVILAGELGGKAVFSLAVDASGNFYVIASGDKDHVYKFSPTGTLLLTITTELSAESPLALDADGNIYVVYQSRPPSLEIPIDREVIAFGPDGKPVIPAGSGFSAQEIEHGEDSYGLRGLATNTVNAAGGAGIYLTATNAESISFTSAYGPPPDLWPAPLKPPGIDSQYAVSVDSDSALLRAQINPRFWADTRYYVEWGGGKCSEGGCAERQPAPPGVLLGAGIVSNAVTSKDIFLTGLSPHTTYHYRFVAQSGGGGPVRGVGGKVGLDGAEGTFTTPALPQPPNSNCANAPLRSGASAFLPDCRAYEMVSPVDKNGGDIVGLCDLACYRTEINQASLDGDKFTYSSYKAFGDALGGPYSSQYMASRGPEGWATHGISPPYASGIYEGTTINYSALLQSEFRAFSSDLSSAWLIDSSRLTLTPDAVEGFYNLYRQDTGNGSLAALTTSEPKFAVGKDYGLELQGRTPDGEHLLFTAEASLTPDAATGSEGQLYAYTGGGLHLVSVLPDGTANADGSTAGTTNAGSGGSIHGIHTLNHAISDDGSRIFWSLLQFGGGPTKLYVRLNPDRPQSALSPGGKCTEPAKACTIAVSSDNAQFWTADHDGSEALFSEKDDLYVFDVKAKVATLVADKVLGVLGASEDLSHVYFVSTESLAPGAVVGQRNLYLDKEGTMTYVTALSGADTGKGNAPSNTHPFPLLHSAKVTPDGRHAAFMSTNSLTGYDNADVNNGKASSEIYVYDAETQQLACVSCNPSGARPDGQELKFPYSRGVDGVTSPFTNIWAAAWLNTSENSLYTPRALSEDGARLFFNSFDALSPRDTNGVQDVYQWEAVGSGDCTTDSASHAEPNGGCVNLISSGESPVNSEFVDATPEGFDVFFKTTASLDPADPGLIDVYDARVGGGYPPPPVPPAPCLGDACQSVPAPPNDPTPSSASFKGAGDPPPRRGCPAGKRRVVRSGKPRCVRKSKKSRHKRRDRRQHGRTSR